jgi:glycosyltransferase involved in cell wall biosynthesis
VSDLDRCAVVIPARDEAATIAEVVAGLRRAGCARVVVADNGSRDATAERARDAGAEVTPAARPGYGWACLAGARAVAGSELVGFIDGDGSFTARDLERLAAVVARGEADLALGARRGLAALALHQRAGNAVVLALFRALYGVVLPDIAPLRVVRGAFLADLDMRGSRYAWLAEMLAKAARRRARISVLPVSYGPRGGGRSKVAGSLRGSLLAGVDLTQALVELRRW